MFIFSFSFFVILIQNYKKIDIFLRKINILKFLELNIAKLYK